LFLSVASVCLAAALIAVPLGKVIIVAGAGSAALATTAAGFAAAGFLPALAVSFVAWFEQPATVKTAAAAKASLSFRWISELNTSHLQRGTLRAKGMRWLVDPFPA
jgi:hypothetical protein